MLFSGAFLSLLAYVYAPVKACKDGEHSGCPVTHITYTGAIGTGYCRHGAVIGQGFRRPLINQTNIEVKGWANK